MLCDVLTTNKWQIQVKSNEVFRKGFGPHVGKDISINVWTWRDQWTIWFTPFSWTWKHYWTLTSSEFGPRHPPIRIEMFHCRIQMINTRTNLCWCCRICWEYSERWFLDHVFFLHLHRPVLIVFPPVNRQMCICPYNTGFMLCKLTITSLCINVVGCFSWQSDHIIYPRGQSHEKVKLSCFAFYVTPLCKH